MISNFGNKNNFLLPQALFLWMVRIENAFDLLQIPASCLNEREINNNGTKSVEEDIKDIEAP